MIRVAALVAMTLACGGRAPEIAGTLLFVNASVVDGSGSPAFSASVRVSDDRIVGVGALERWRGETMVDLGGLVLAPGFIDTHSHADWQIDEYPGAEGAVSQGITTVVVGNDGESNLPLSDLFASLQESPSALNFASFTGHGNLRGRVMGRDDYRRAATASEITRMAELLRTDMEAGSLGLSTGLEYDPGIYATASEVVELARVAAEYGGRYISHIRSEDRFFWEAVEEVIEIGRQARLPVQIGHMKLAMVGLWGQAATLLAMLDAARAQGIEVTADVYPYTFWQSTLTVLFPARDFEDLSEARFVVEQVVRPEGALIADYLPEPSYAGKTLAEIAALRGEDPAVSLLALIRTAETMRATVDADAAVESVIGTSMSEGDIEAIMRWPHTNFSTDGALAGTHPRGYGSFPRILGRYVREREVLPLEEAVHKLSGLAAEHMGWSDRGLIMPGQAADLVVFDPARVIDTATTADPRSVSRGIEQVWVGGVRVWDGAGITGERPGRVLRREAR